MTKVMKKHIISLENYENHEKLKNQCENSENHEKHRIPYRIKKIKKFLEFHARIMKFM